MSDKSSIFETFLEKHYFIVVLIFIAIIVFILTLFSIKESRSDSFKLMVMEGNAFIETLTSSAENAMSSEKFYDYLVHKRYQEIVIELTQSELTNIDETKLSQLAINHNLYSIFIYDIDSQLVAGTVIRGTNLKPPDYVYEEIQQLISNPEENFILLLDEGESPDEVVHYYMEITNKMDRVILLIVDAYYYLEALEQTQISFLAQRMAQEPRIEYIIYQADDAIIFSSLRAGDVILDQSDEFLISALESDTVMHRRLDYRDTEILEMVRPLATVKNPSGLLRVGLSLESYNTIVQGFDRQMITLAIVMFVLIVVIVLYINSRNKRKEISRQYHEIKSISDKIFEEMKTGVAAVDKYGIVYLANDAFEKIINLKRTTELKWNDCFKYSNVNHEMLLNNINDSFELEITFESKNNVKQLLLAISKRKSESEDNDGFVAVISDVTRLKELEQKTTRRERLSEMGNLAAGVAHEIRNPLNSISIASQRLAAEFQPDENVEEYRSFTKQINDETKRLNEIITRFLALAREEKDKQKEFNLSYLIEDFYKLIKPEADKLGIEIKSDIRADVKLNGSPDDMKQVLSNLYNNTKEALYGKGGVITLTVRQSENNLIIEFADSGPGIPENIRRKIFTPYYTTKEAGTGLGLPTVYRIITEMGGDIKVESSELGGVKFIIIFQSYNLYR